jgi:hypothetical protein
MSKLTAAQVINLGEYLETDFDPSALTVSQLLGVLGFHNIRYSTPYTKGKLVQLFNDEVKTRSSKFKKDRIKQENSMASDDGIMDGITGKPLNGKGKVSGSGSNLQIPIKPSSDIFFSTFFTAPLKPSN